MSIQQDELLLWSQKLLTYHLPRWEDLPDIELYMDQVITLIERYLEILSDGNHSKIITAAMINNYVKSNIMPKPAKKRYSRVHMAYLIVISILKQVLTINEIKDGIMLQVCLEGEQNAYDRFCTEQERALRMVALNVEQPSQSILPIENTKVVDKASLALHMAATSFACKILTEKIIFIRKQSYLTESTNHGKKDEK